MPNSTPLIGSAGASAGCADTVRRDAALAVAAHLGPVLPLHTAIDGVCDCPKGKDCGKNAGKHPRTRNGVNDATTDETAIRRWWSMWPNANIGLALEPAGLVDVAPDSDRWLDEFGRRGLPRTICWESGSGAGHVHHLYQVPAGWPRERACHPDEYDVLSSGYAVLPPSTNGRGPYTWLVPPEQIAAVPLAPLWVREILDTRKRAKAASSRVEATGTGDEPPVRLAGRALARWLGDPDAFRVADRSGMLVAIAFDLARANASLRTITDALADRDETLGLGKYSDRPDAVIRYAEIALRALAEYARIDSDDVGEPDNGPAKSLCAGNCHAQQTLDVVRDIMANLNVSGSAKLSLIGLVIAFAWFWLRRPEDSRRVNLDKLHDIVGLSNGTISTGLRVYAADEGTPDGLLRWEHGERQRDSFAKPIHVSLLTGSLAELGKRARDYNPHLKRHGGARPVPTCPDGHTTVAQIIEQTTRESWRCAAGEVFAETERHTRRERAVDPGVHDDSQGQNAPDKHDDHQVQVCGIDAAEGVERERYVKSRQVQCQGQNAPERRAHRQARQPHGAMPGGILWEWRDDASPTQVIRT